MIKKRKRKGKKRKRRKPESREEEEEVVSIQAPEKKRKLDHISVTTSKRKKKEENGKDESQVNPNTRPDGSVDPLKEKKDAVKKDYTKKFNKNIRLASEVDFLDVGICKDYQRTGTCGYGMNCIYAHIREDYKSSFEISKEYEEQQRREQRGEVSDDSDDESDSDEDGIPSSCAICDEEMKDPVVTKCHHFFCEKCIMKHYKFGKNPHCPICGMPTDGVFNSADDIIKNKKKKDEQEKREKEEKEGEIGDGEERKFRMGWNY